MPQTAISTPDHTASVTRMTLGITSARGETAAPSNMPVGAPFCAADEE